MIVKTTQRFVFSSTGGGVGTQVSPVREFLRPAAARLRGLEKGASTFKGNTAAGWWAAAASGTRILPSTVTRNTPRHDSVTTSQPRTSHITPHNIVTRHASPGLRSAYKLYLQRFLPANEVAWATVPRAAAGGRKV